MHKSENRIPLVRVARVVIYKSKYKNPNLQIQMQNSGNRYHLGEGSQGGCVQIKIKNRNQK